MTSTARLRTAAVAWCLLVSAVVPTVPGAAAESQPLAARLSSADAAMEYWDLTAWFDSGERVVARFLVTNQGPGDRTAAAVGHVVLGDGRTLPFQWGRRRDAWTLGTKERRLEIGKAVLDLSGPTLVLTVTSKKRGIDLRLEIDRSAGAASSHDPEVTYGTEVVLPATARGRIGYSDVSGTGAVTHTWMDRAEGDLLQRRDELLARAGDVALYLSVRTLPDGRRRQTLFVRHGDGVTVRGDETRVDFSGAAVGDDERYPVRSTWSATGAGVGLDATLERELLRLNPLDILPQPFRFLLSLGGRPQRVWSNARVKLALDAHATTPARATELRGVVVSTFAHPVER